MSALLRRDAYAEPTKDRIRREARVRARLALSGHRGVLRTVSLATRRAVAAMAGPDTVGQPGSRASED